MRQKERKTTEKETRHQRCHDSLHCPKDKGKGKQITNSSVSVLKGKLKFYRYKIVKYKPRAFSRKIEIKPIPILLIIFRLPRKVKSDIVVLFSRRIVRIYAQFHRLCYKTIGSCF